jgi:head-tail adaptor
MRLLAGFHRGLPLRLLKIVMFSKADARIAQEKFDVIRSQAAAPERRPEKEQSGSGAEQTNAGIDLFLSYCHEDTQAAKRILDSIQSMRPATRIFSDRTSLRTGSSWLMQIAESLDTSRRVVALYTPNYWKSNYCKDEFTAAITRQNDTGDRILFPVYFRNAQLPYLFQHLQYLDCREGDEDKLSGVCSSLLEGL